MAGLTGNLFINVGLIFIAAALAGFILRLLKQPQILAYVLVGFIVTPLLGLVTDIALIESLSIIGIAFLLFLVGIEMDLKSLRSVAMLSTFGGTAQIAIVFVFGYIIALALGYLSLEAAYVGLILAFSSTMVVMKLLSDKKELPTLHGRIVIGILLVQDMFAIFALSVLSSINGFSLSILGLALFKFATLFFVAFLCSRYIFPVVFRYAAKNQELLLVSSLAVCFLFSLAFHYMEFSIAIGAFVAGVTLGNLQYSIEIRGKIKSLKDFFALTFFVSLGMGISLEVIKNNWLVLLILLLFVFIAKPFIIMTICSLFRYPKKPSFLTANALAQVGEFSLILAAQGLLLGHISQDLFSVAVLVTIISIVFTSYYIEYNQFWFNLIGTRLRFFDRFTQEGFEYLSTQKKPKIVLCGHNRIGYSILRDLKKDSKKVLVIDYNPEIISRVAKEGFHCIYGDIGDDEIIERMHLDQISMIISTVPDIKDNLHLIKKVREHNKRARVLVTAQDTDHALKLYSAGADYVILPHFLGGELVSSMIGDLRHRKRNMKQERDEHIKHLNERRKIGHEHPKHVA